MSSQCEVTSEQPPARLNTSIIRRSKRINEPTLEVVRPNDVLATVGAEKRQPLWIDSIRAKRSLTTACVQLRIVRRMRPELR
jgi:hypothetical protein